MSFGLLKACLEREAAHQPHRRVLLFDLLPAYQVPGVNEEMSAGNLKVYNVMVCDVTTGETVCYMWHEGEAVRGKNELASCVMQHILSRIPSHVTHLTLFSKGDMLYKNFSLCAMFLTTLERHQSLVCLDHITLGAEEICRNWDCVENFSTIDEFIKSSYRHEINVPSDLYKLVEEAGNFLVKELKNDLYDFDSLFSNNLFTKVNKTTDGRRLVWREICWFQYAAENNCVVRVKSSYHTEAQFDTLSLRRRPLSGPIALQRKEPCHPLPAHKKSCLLRKIQTIGAEFHSFYLNLHFTSEEANDEDGGDADSHLMDDNIPMEEEVMEEE